jgi:hypothetical protein
MLAATPASVGLGGAFNDPAGSVNRIAAGTVTTPNWAGYAVARAAGAFHRISASWSQPSVTCSSGENTAASFWVGLDGYNSRTVEQIGTDSDCVNGSPRYYAWYELYPKKVTLVSLLTAGQTIDASVSVANGTFTLTLNGTPFTQVSRRATLSSAEVIVEAPSSNHGPSGTLSLAHFAPVSFSAADVNSGTLASFNPDEVIMATGAAVNALPSSLGGDGASFVVTWKHG